ncbi:HAD family hydrolase [Actinotalea fermentans]|uniref:Haloacid dehalogenase n=1 Tax=Actinotalea fermentans TaxID=43671 RepID=A0A511YY13_9CELL|nr:HAD family hydrolase [Actinotalea fermentans]KGM15994.1 HAD family hydrolase [Actinotalea fermentans ATCC 43279 = JCM 9966 = DSM 3133]GEN80090.1 haloacid dehalogenase [Actinotalea fermentans]
MTPTSSDARDAAGAVLFDIDGTLVDSTYLHVHAWMRAFADLGEELTRPVDAWRVHRGIGMGSALLLADLLGDDADRLADRAKDAHAAHYRELADLQRPFDGARDLVRAVAERGARAVLATSAAPAELEELLTVLDLDDVLTGVTSAKDVDNAKPEPDLVQAALDIAGVPPERAVLVGDTGWDVEAAARAGVPCVAVLTGGVSEAELREAGAAAVYRDVAALLADLDQSPLALAWHVED